MNNCLCIKESFLTSSGHMINLKFSKSSGSGNSVLQVFGRFNSLISGNRQIVCEKYGFT